MDTFADDLAELIEKLELQGAACLELREAVG